MVQREGCSVELVSQDSVTGGSEGRFVFGITGVKKNKSVHFNLGIKQF